MTGMNYDDIIRLIVSIVSMFIALFWGAHRFCIIEKETQQLSKTKIIVLLCGIVCLSFILSNMYWMNISIIDYLISPYDLYILCVMITLTIFSLYIILENALDVADYISNKIVFSRTEMMLNVIQITGLFIVTCIQLSIMRFMYNHESGGYEKTFILLLLGVFLFINKVISIGFNKLKRLDKTEKQLAIIRAQNEKQLEKYIELNKKYEETSKIVHDVRKHLEILDMLMKDKDSDAEKYRENINSQLGSLTSVFNCQHKILSVIMSQKIMEAEAKKIKVHIDMVDVDFDIMEDIDMTALFVNLWDNAIEANMKLDEDKRMINIVIGKMLDNIVVSFKNSYNGNTSYDGKRLLSLKGEGHGYGIAIIKETIKKYRGIHMVENDELIFHTKIIIPISI